VGAQLLLTTAACVGFAYVDGMRDWAKEVRETKEVLCFTIIFLPLVLLVIVTCCFEELLRKFPQNYVFLFVWTALESLGVGMLCAVFPADIVVQAIGITAAITVVLGLFALQTTYDFTGFGPYLFVFLLCLMGFGILASFSKSETVKQAYSCGGALLFSCYIVYDVQLIQGGAEKKHEYSVDDYILAALNLYLDIINLFLYILQILAADR